MMHYHKNYEQCSGVKLLHEQLETRTKRAGESRELL